MKSSQPAQVEARLSGCTVCRKISASFVSYGSAACAAKCSELGTRRFCDPRVASASRRSKRAVTARAGRWATAHDHVDLVSALEHPPHQARRRIPWRR
jgi:hypothetical protein